MYGAAGGGLWYDNRLKAWEYSKMLSARRMVGYLGRRESFIALRSTVCKIRTLTERRTPVIWCARGTIIGCRPVQHSDLLKYGVRWLSSENLPAHTKVMLPALSPTMELGTIVSWEKQEGDELGEGDLLAQIETDKATMEFETPEEGFLAKIILPAGSKDVPIGKLLCIIVENKEDVDSFKDFVAEEDAASVVEKPSEAEMPLAPATETLPPPPPTQTPPPPPPVAAVSPPTPSPTVASGGRVFASPFAKKMAQDKGIDLASLQGSGPGGRVVAQDVSVAMPAVAAATPTPVFAPACSSTPPSFHAAAMVDGIWLWTLPYSYMYGAAGGGLWYDNRLKAWEYSKMLSARRMVGYLGRRQSFIALRSTACKIRTLTERRTPVIWCARGTIIGCRPVQHSDLLKYGVRWLSSENLPAHTKVMLPALSPTMELGTIVSWEKQEGDELGEGDLLAQIETDKATMEFETPEEGFLAKIILPAGSKDVPIGKLLCIIVENKEDVDSFKDFVAEEDAASVVVRNFKFLRFVRSWGLAFGFLTMNRPRSTNNSLAAEAFPAPGSSSQLGPQAPLPQSSVASVPSSAPVPVDEIAAAVAQAIGSVLPGMLSSIQSTSTAISSSSPSASAVSVSLHQSDLRVPEHPRISVGPPFSSPSSSSVASSGAEFMDIPLTNVRKVIAKRLLESKQTIPHYYLSVDIRMDDLLEVRKQLNEDSSGAYKLSVNDFVLKACALAFACILAVGKAEKQVLVDENSEKGYTTGTVMSVTLSCDHRVVDGAVGAQWLAAFKTYLEKPMTMLL
ncbi:PREDICTED: uncharacterized protein LOC107341758 [Acropora digitifera]|uniref:uncharacterized protein LOC107341758 n=1 Tax=Acropora digitifera TaxID=70779 RepID=UPI00077AB5C5|nr:PREDICTED: uncharacterized protein LOC107341758 [Acropora digitifera]